MTQRIPPPPQLTGPEWQSFNRWLLEITSILEASGSGIDPSALPGYTQMQTDIANLQFTQSIQQSQINSALFGVGNLNGRVLTLEAAPAVFSGTTVPGAGLGKDTDWYYNRSGAAGARLYIKVAGAWAAQAI